MLLKFNEQRTVLKSVDDLISNADLLQGCDIHISVVGHIN